ncbi:MAG: hypothetical protein ACO27R_13335, partial [Hylemonella sp.]
RLANGNPGHLRLQVHQGRSQPPKQGPARARWPGLTLEGPGQLRLYPATLEGALRNAKAAVLALEEEMR